MCKILSFRITRKNVRMKSNVETPKMFHHFPSCLLSYRFLFFLFLIKIMPLVFTEFLNLTKTKLKDPQEQFFLKLNIINKITFYNSKLRKYFKTENFLLILNSSFEF